MPKTLAVLPFINMSASSEHEYFSDGITEEIINALSKIKSLKVTSRTSSFYFKNKNIPLKQIAKELNVLAVLEGSVRVAGDTIRISAQLIQAEDDFHFWSETWDRKMANIFAVQDDISLLIADKLREHFGHFEIAEHLVQKQTDTISAYEYYLKALFHFRKWNPTDIRIAISLYDKALAIDPAHSQSMLGLADCYGFLATTGFMPAAEGWMKSAQLTNQALALNNELPGVHYQLANLAFFTECDYRKAFNETAKAIELKPNFAEAQQFMSFLYIIAGEKEKSREHLNMALSLDPLSQETSFYSAYFHYMIGDYSTALEQLDKCILHNPKNLPAHSVKCYCLLKLGRAEEVINYFDTLPKEIVVPGDKLGLTTIAYAVKRDNANAAKYLTQLLEHTKTPDGFRAHSYLFLTYAVSGETEKAIEWISEAIKNKSSLLLFNFADPLVSSIKNDPRYIAFHKIIYQKDFALEAAPKKKELLDEAMASTYSARLLKHIDEHKPYLNPDLTLRLLAEQVNIHPNQLSWLLNESLGKNFNEFVNHYRVEAFKKIAKDPTKAHITLIGLAFECGFNSKTVFNTYFKKETGMTPKEFLKSGE
jgi:adenylate cyclase